MKNDNITVLIKNLSLDFDKVANKILTSYNLTSTQYRILKFLYDNDNIIQLDIQKAYSLTNPTVTGILNNMEKEGWIKRVLNPLDSRSKFIKLTDKAILKKEELYDLGDKFEITFTKNLSVAEKKELLRLINKIKEQYI